MRGALCLALPFSPGGQGLLELTPKASRNRQRQLPPGRPGAGARRRCSAEGLLPLVRLPCYYLSPRLDLGRLHEHEAVDALAGSARVLGGSSAGFQETLGLEGRLRSEPWFLPSRAGAQAVGDTSRDGAVHAQKRKLRFSLGKDLVRRRPRADRLAFDAAWEEAWDYTSKVRSRSLDTITRLELGGRRLPGTLRAEHTLRYARERQRVGDERLYLFPGQPAGELPVSLRGRTATRCAACWTCATSGSSRCTARASRLRSLLRGGSAEERIVHEEWLEVENQLLCHRPRGHHAHPHRAAARGPDPPEPSHRGPGRGAGLLAQGHGRGGGAHREGAGAPGSRRWAWSCA